MSNIDVQFAVGIDGMSGIFEESASNPRRAAERKRERWADATTRATSGRVTASPDEVYQALQELRISAPREREGQPIPAGRFYRELNARLIRRLDSSYPEGDVERASRALQNRLRSDNRHFTIYPDMQKFVEWLAVDLNTPPWIVTAQRDERMRKMLRRWQTMRQHFAGMVTTQALRYDKLRPEFWAGWIARLGVPAERVVMIGSNLITDTYATVVGVSVVVLDRDGFHAKFVQQYFGAQGHFRDAPILRRGENIPPRQAVIYIAGSLGEARDWLLAFKEARAPQQAVTVDGGSGSP